MVHPNLDNHTSWHTKERISEDTNLAKEDNVGNMEGRSNQGSCCRALAELDLNMEVDIHDEIPLGQLQNKESVANQNLGGKENRGFTVLVEDIIDTELHTQHQIPEIVQAYIGGPCRGPSL